MSIKVELQYLLDIALATPEPGNVNFNVLRGFLLEVLKHLEIRKKTVLITDDEDFKYAYDLIRDGIVVARSRTPSELNLVDEHVSQVVLAPQTVSPLLQRREVSSQDDVLLPSSSQSRRSKSASPRLSDGALYEQQNYAESLSADGASTTPGEISLTITPADGRESGSSGYTKYQKKQDQSKSVSDASRRSVEMMVRRGDTLKSLTRRISDLNARVDVLETSRPISMVKSTASMFFHGETKTPTKDMIGILNVERKLEALQTTSEGLTEMIDVILAGFNEFKEEVFPKISKIQDIATDVEKLKPSFVDMEMKVDEHKIMTEDGIDENTKRIEAMKAMLQDLQNGFQTLQLERKPSLDMTHIERIVDRKIQHEINLLAQKFSQSSDKDAPPIVMSSEPPSELYEALDAIESLREAQGSLETQVSELAASLESRDDAGEEDTDIPHHLIHDVKQELKTLKKKVEHSVKDAGQAISSTRRLDVESKQTNSTVESNKTQLQQLQNNMIMLKEEAQEMSSTLQALLMEKKEQKPRDRARSTDEEDISLIRAMIFDLQVEKENLKKANKDLLDELLQKQKALDDLYEQLEIIQVVKADKELVSSEIRVKADRNEVALKVEKQDFDRYIGLVDQSLRDLLERLEGHENVLREAIDSISNHVKTKLDKAEVEPLKLYLEERVKALKPKAVVIREPEEYAAGFRKVLIKNFSCISCDRPVEYARDNIFPPLPLTQAMPVKKSNRPYTTYELDQIRQHMLRGGLDTEQERFEAIDNRRKRLQSELLKLSGVPTIEDLADVVERPCGGSHTLSFPHSRSVVRGLNMNRDDFAIEAVKNIKNLQTVDIMGQDGHIYKGLVEDVTVLPQLGDKPSTPRSGSVAQRLLKEGTQHSQSPSLSSTPQAANCEQPLDIEDAGGT